MKKEYDLIICDTLGHLSGEDVKFKSMKERDAYIKKVGELLIENKERLKQGKESGNAIVGANSFSFSSLGELVFGKENTKRFLVWNKDEESEKGYIDSLAFFGWAVAGKGWIFNLQEGKKFFRGEYLETEYKYKTPLEVTRDIVRTFSNEGGKVLNIALFSEDVIKEAVELEGREYIGLGVKEKDGVK